MLYIQHMLTVKIPKSVTQGDELLILNRKEYQDLCRLLDEMREALVAIREGEDAYRTGKVKYVKSLNDLS